MVGGNFLHPAPVDKRRDEGGRGWPRPAIDWGRPPPTPRSPGGTALVALGDQVVEHLIMGLAHRFQTEVVDDDQWRLHQVLEAPLIGVGGSGRMQVAQQFRLRGKQHVVALPYGAVADGLGDMALAGAARPGDQQGDFFLDEAAGGQVPDEFLVQLWV